MDASGEVSGEQSPEGRWVSYDELGKIRGIGRESAVKLAQRKRWRRVRGNNGEARVYVPGEWLVLAKETSPEPSPERSPELSRTISILEAAVASLTERAQAAEQARVEVSRRLDQAESALDALRQAEAAWWAQGLLKRLQLAWRGRR